MEQGKTLRIEAISAITLATHDMARAVAFYTGLGFALRYGGPASGFSSFHIGSGYINLMAVSPEQKWGQWGRFILYVSDVDAMHKRALETGFAPEFTPRDAPWGERYFHIKDPDGHELSFARLLREPD